MSSLSPFALMVIGCWLACVVLEAAFLVIDSELVAGLLRPLLARRLARANFSRMLQRHDVDPARYLDTHRASDVRAELTRCEGCNERHRCDAALAGDDRRSIDFCPNRAAIERASAATDD